MPEKEPAHVERQDRYEEVMNMARALQHVKNTMTDAIFITLEPWAARYRLKPGDVLEIDYGLECRHESHAPLEVHVGMEGDKIGLFIWVNSSGDPKLRLNGGPAIEDFASD